MDEVKYAVPPVNETAIETAAQLLMAADVASRATVCRHVHCRPLARQRLRGSSVSA